MWRAVRRLQTGFTPHRSSDQDSAVSIAIVRSKSYMDIVNAASLPNVKLGNITFAFRMLSRYLKSDKSTKKVLSENKFRTMMNTVKDNIEKLDSQGVCDILFWLRVSNAKGIYSFHRTEIIRIVNKAEDLTASSSFNSKQLINLYYDITQINHYSFKLESRIEELVNNRNEILNHIDYQTILTAATKGNHSTSKRISKTLLERIYLSSLLNTDILLLTGYLNTIPTQFIKFQYNPKLAEFIDKLKEAILCNISHITSNEAKTIIDFYEKFPNQDTKLFDECIESQYSMLKSRPNFFTNSNLKHLAVFISSLNFIPVPFSFPQEFKFVLKDVLVKKISVRKPDDFIYELVSALGILEIKLNPEEQKLVLNSLVTSDFQGLYPFHFARMLFKLGIEDVEFLFKVTSTQNYNSNFTISNDKREREKLLLINDACQSMKYKEIPIIREILEKVFQETLRQISDYNVIKFSGYLRNFIMDNSAKEYHKAIVEKIITILEEEGSYRDPKQKLTITLDVLEYSPEISIAFIKKLLPELPMYHIATVLRRYVDLISYENLLRIVYLIDRKYHENLSVLISKSKESKEHKLTIGFFKILDETDLDFLNHTIFLDNAEEIFDKIEDESWNMHLENFFKKLNRGLYSIPFYEMDHKYLAIAGNLARLNKLDPNFAYTILQNVKVNGNQDINHILYIAALDPKIHSKPFKDNMLSEIFTPLVDYNLLIVKQKLQAYFKWPKYEGDAEDKYAEEISSRIQSLKTSQLNPAIDLVSGIPEIYPKFVHEKLGLKILSTTITKVSTELPNITSNCIPVFLKAFYRNANNIDSSFYDQLFDKFEHKFDQVTDYYKSDVLRCMAFNGLKYESSIDKIVKHMYENPMNFITSDYLSALESLSDLNMLQHRDRLLDESLKKLSKGANTKKSLKEHTYIGWVWSLIHMNADRQLLESYANLYRPDPVLPTFLFKKLLAYKYFEVNNIPFGQKEERENLEKRMQPFMSFGIWSHWFRDLESKFLSNDLKLNTFVDGNYIPALHVPTQTAIWPVSNLVKIHRQKELKGAFKMHKKFIEESGLKLSMPSGYNLQEMSSEEILNSPYERSS